ncbi:hypothetical protein ACMA1I_05325 [Pontibacter sp. 13R65]|uniref:hypothetical protein n=1 Tax=Pontibacter sp. 13R65 TaxID=3127458 RepID=UPI00301C50F9
MLKGTVKALFFLAFFRPRSSVGPWWFLTLRNKLDKIRPSKAAAAPTAAPIISKSTHFQIFKS